MANLVCWASGLLQVLPNKDTPAGPVVISSGTAGRLNSDMRTWGDYVEHYRGYYVPGCLDVPVEGREEGDVHRDRMTLVIAWSKKLRTAKVKRTGVRALRRMGEVA